MRGLCWRWFLAWRLAVRLNSMQVFQCEMGEQSPDMASKRRRTERPRALVEHTLVLLSPHLTGARDWTRSKVSIKRPDRQEHRRTRNGIT